MIFEAIRGFVLIHSSNCLSADFVNVTLFITNQPFIFPVKLF